ncbi:MAG: regulatory protein RecX [Desulfobacteraceae bacterium]|nr:regulatory protein RecX [Desulfobacteraceae bacterium]
MNLNSENNKEIQLPLNLSIKYLAYQPRTIYEIQAFLKKKGFNKNIIESVVDILINYNYLNDKDYAKLFIESKVKCKAKSKFALAYELKKKGVSDSIINEALKTYDDFDLAFKSVQPKIKHWQKFDDKTFKKKLMNFLHYRGFSYDICISTLNHYIN